MFAWRCLPKTCILERPRHKVCVGLQTEFNNPQWSYLEFVPTFHRNQYYIQRLFLTWVDFAIHKKKSYVRWVHADVRCNYQMLWFWLRLFELSTISVTYHYLFRSYLLKYSLFFASTLVLTSSVDIVFILSLWWGKNDSVRIIQTDICK